MTAQALQKQNKIVGILLVLLHRENAWQIWQQHRQQMVMTDRPTDKSVAVSIATDFPYTGLSLSM